MRIFSRSEAVGFAFLVGFVLGGLVIDYIYQERITEHCVITAIPAARPADGAE